MKRRHILGLAFVVGLAVLAVGAASTASPGTAPPPQGWANLAPTFVEQVVDRPGFQLLEVSQGSVRTWVRVPDVGVRVGDYVLLGQGRMQPDVDIPELGTVARELVDIDHVQVADYDTAVRSVRSPAPADAVAIEAVYAELAARADREVVVYGTVVKAPDAIGYRWVHLQDGSGDPAAGTHDLTVKTQASVTVGQRVAFRGTLRRDVDLGFGYHYDALVEGGLKLAPVN
ncbi:MAG: hypothetical protein AAF799_17570 [Myxococcota bacterium]